MKNCKIIPLMNKDIRSKVIKKYLGNDKCFCFSCGNAVKFLCKNNVNVIGVSKDDYIMANKEINVFESKHIFDCFDATSGHLPMTLISEISKEIKKRLPKDIFNSYKKIAVPVGSGETLLCFMLLFPIHRLIGFYGDYPPIKFDMSPLKEFLMKHSELQYIKGVSSIKSCINKIKIYTTFGDDEFYFIDTEPWKKK